jgi:hypothetical protein
MVPAMGFGGSRIQPRRAGLLLAACCAAAGPLACDRNVNLGAITDGAANVLWSAGFERGDLSEWEAGGEGGADLENIDIAPAVSTAVAHTGRYAGKATVLPAGGMESINYFVRQQPSPTRAYYAAWFYITPFAVKTWLSIIHFRGSHTGDGENVYPIWDVNLYTRPDGSLVAHLYHFVTQTNYEEPAPVPVPLGRWVHFEVFLDKASDATGRITVWQDGAAIIDTHDVTTVETPWTQWGVGGSSTDVDPAPAVLYVDDATISINRVGTDG